MRIVCPRCVAQYEVDETAIPETGREVQCANCENIWFQDYIEMLPDRPAETTAQTIDAGVFDDLDGKSDATFASARRNIRTDDETDDDWDPDDDDDEYDPENLLSEDDDPDGFDDEDDIPNPDLPVPPVDEDVLDVLRSEAAFSSARAKIDAAAAQALDGDGAERKLATSEDDDATPPATEETDLAAFLDAHSDDEPEDEQPFDEAEEDEHPDDTPKESADQERDIFDPLADLDAIRSQLAEIEDTPAADDEPEATPYTPNLPPDDPVAEPDTDDFDDDEIAAEDQPVDDQDDATQEEDAFDPAALAAAVAAATDTQDAQADDADTDDLDSDDFDDDFEEEPRPRRAYRADGGQPEADPEPEFDEEPEPESEPDSEPEPDPDPLEADIAAVAAASAPAVAVGMARPRAKGGRARARSLAGFEAPQPDGAVDPEPEIAPIEAEIPEDLPAREADHGRKPKKDRAQNRKALLPDVDELDASLRSDADQPRRRDQEMMEAHEQELKRASGGGFRRAFIWTIFIIALLLALYVMRPQIVAAVPAAAMVLDPYAAVIDSLRLMIDGLLGG